MKLWLCLRFTHLALHCLSRSEHRPIAVVHTRCVLQVNDNAAALGVTPGMGLGTLRALLSSDDATVKLLSHDPAARRRHLQQLCCWGYGITPALHTWREECLLLEIGGCLTLHGGLQNLLARIERGLGERGERYQYGLAETPLAAWLLSFAPPPDARDLQRELSQRLAPLPLDLLDQFPRQVSALRRAGLHSLGDLLALPRRELALRCGTEFNAFLARALGHQAEPRDNYRPPPVFRDSIWFGYEITSSAELNPAVGALLDSLCRFLRNTQLQAGSITWELWNGSRAVRHFTVRTRTCGNQRDSWQQLTLIHLERKPLPFAAQGIALHTRDLTPVQAHSGDLFPSSSSRESPEALLDRLLNRLGVQALQRLVSRDEHLPEAATLSMVFDALSDEGCTAGGQRQRPFWLMAAPAPLSHDASGLRWHGGLYLLHGPERIEDNWWRQAISRDYYIARDAADSHYYWIFHDRMARRWYMHGIFA